MEDGKDQVASDEVKEPYHWLKPYQWKKGESGNKGGRPKNRKSMPAILDEILHDDTTQKAYDLARKLMDIAEHGEDKDAMAAMEKIMQRVYGNVAKKQEITVEGPTKLVELMDADTPKEIEGGESDGTEDQDSR